MEGSSRKGSSRWTHGVLRTSTGKFVQDPRLALLAPSLRALFISLSLSLLLLILLSFALLLFPFFQRYSTCGHFPFFASLIRRRLALTSSCVKSDRKVLRKLSEELGRLLLLEDRNSGEVSQIIDLFRKTNFESIFRFIMFVEFKRYSMKGHRKCFNNKRIIN